MFPNALFNFLSPKTRTPTSMSVPHSLLFCFCFWLLWILRSTFEPMLLLCHWRAITAAAASKSNVLRLVELVLVASKRVCSAVVEYIWNNGERWGRNKKSSGRQAQAARERWKIHKIKKKRKKKHTTLFWHSLSLLVFVSLPRVTDVASVCQRTAKRDGHTYATNHLCLLITAIVRLVHSIGSKPTCSLLLRVSSVGLPLSRSRDAVTCSAGYRCPNCCPPTKARAIRNAACEAVMYCFARFYCV